MLAILTNGQHFGISKSFHLYETKHYRCFFQIFKFIDLQFAEGCCKSSAKSVHYINAPRTF